jgi:hypothetical protein
MLYVIVAVLVVVAVFAILALTKVSRDKKHNAASAAAQANPGFAVNYEEGGQGYLDVTASTE